MKDQGNSNCLAYLVLFALAGAIIREFGGFGALYLLLLVSLVIAISSKTYRKFIGIVLGIGVLTSLIYIFLKNTENSGKLFLAVFRPLSV